MGNHINTLIAYPVGRAQGYNERVWARQVLKVQSTIQFSIYTDKTPIIVDIARSSLEMQSLDSEKQPQPNTESTQKGSTGYI